MREATNMNNAIRSGSSATRNQEDGGVDIEIRQLSRSSLASRSEEIAALYIAVFSEEPWYEKLLVKLDGRMVRFGSPEELDMLERLKAEGKVKAEDIRPFYTAEDVKANVRVCSGSEGFAALSATDRSNGQMVGVSWGMLAEGIPSEEKLLNVKAIMGISGLAAGSAFYFDETFVDVRYRGIGVGKGLVKERGRIAAKLGCTYAVGRTINNTQINNFVGVFGRENISEAYSDPEDIQPDRKYYLIKLLREKLEVDE
jgi:GNAT superfamily N-acetyltransferase